MEPTHRLPVFPLPLVLFPGVRLPLHIFEPRYRQMLADVRAGDRRFVIVAAIPGVEERDLPPGRAACIAELVDVESLPDGRSNIVVKGTERVALTRFVDDAAPYHVAEFTPLPDTPGDRPVALAVAGEELAARFRRVALAVRTIEGDTDPLPTLPDDPVAAAYAAAAMIDIDLAERQALLEERSPAARIARVDAVLRRVLPGIEMRAAVAGRGDSDD
jgi:Lon protease-like protein